ncbi:MAG: methylenetetrahydrofolate reductase [Pseudomonadota bacterium]
MGINHSVMECSESTDFAHIKLKRDWLTSASIEITPKQIMAGDPLIARLEKRKLVYIPFLPGQAIESLFDPCRVVLQYGLRPVPHLAARAFASRHQLSDALSEFAHIGVDTVLLIAGDLAEPAGPFANALDVLNTELLAEFGFRQIAVAGHPQGHPVAGSDDLLAALHAKQTYAERTGAEMWIVTQFAFSAGPLVDWQARLAKNGVRLPIDIGLPSPAKIRTLLSYALHCGVAASAKTLIKSPSALRLLGKWSPDGIIDELAAHRAHVAEPQIRGLHVFPFGGVTTYLEWRRNLIAQYTATLSQPVEIGDDYSVGG